jgi:hypothetical protein
MDASILLERLTSFERRVRQLYLTLGDHSGWPAELLFFWNAMAEDERHHLAILERSASLLDMIESPPQVSEATLALIDDKITAAETVTQNPDLSSDEALQHALILEGSEINSLDAAWFQSFRSSLGALLQAMTPDEDVHIHRLVNAVHAFSKNKALQEQAASLWASFQRGKLGLARARGSQASE